MPSQHRGWGAVERKAPELLELDLANDAAANSLVPAVLFAHVLEAEIYETDRVTKTIRGLDLHFWLLVASLSPVCIIVYGHVIPRNEKGPHLSYRAGRVPLRARVD